MSANRRSFIKSVMAAGVGLAAGRGVHAQDIKREVISKPLKPEWNITQPQDLPKGRFAVMAYAHKHIHTEYTGDSFRSALISVDYPSKRVSVASSFSSNLHDLVAPLENPGKVFFGIGQDVNNVLEIFNEDLTLRTRLSVDGWRFKGHGLPYGRGILVSAESVDRPESGGFLLYMNAAGTILSRHRTGGLSPHDIIECGDYLAVAHYGNERRTEPHTGGLFFDLVGPGVSFLKKDTLELVKFHHLEQSQGAITHIAKQGNGQVIAMALQFTKPAYDGPVDQAVMRQAIADGVNLIAEETGPDAVYQMPLPLYYVDVDKGVTGLSEAPPDLMRRGQSFCQDPDLKLTVATFAASQTIMVQDANTRVIRYLNALDYGIADPRGCAMLPKTGCVAISGNSNNIAIINLYEDRLVELIGVTLEKHSHLAWLAA